jgi:LPS O-antigen subunit length determinant protein (WzzB/FepE family)
LFFLLFCSKQTSIEIEQLNIRVMEAETRLKTEVTRIKKKLHIQITELEMSLDVANKSNIELQKTVKRQSLSLTVSFSPLIMINFDNFSENLIFVCFK